MQLLDNGWVAPTQRTIPPFRLSRPGTVEQALDAWTGGGAEPVYAQGCTDLVAAFREGLQCSTLVSLARVAELCEVRREGDDLVIGAGVDHHQGSARPLVTGALPGFAAAWGAIATTRVRLRATIGGNLMARRTRYEMSIMLDALGADVRFATPEGPRVLSPAQVWDGPPVPGALLTTVRIPAVTAVRFGYERSMRPLMTVAATLRGDRLRLVAGSEYGRPATAGAPFDGDAPATSALAAAALPERIGDAAASTAYRRRVAAVLAARALSRTTEQEPA